ncbi:MAG: PEP-CTERM sorting domain-containing protein [Planctomycetota bacterium]
MRRLGLHCAATALLLSCLVSAASAAVTSDPPTEPTPPGGLSGEFYKADESFGSIEDAISTVQSNTPDATFLATATSYSGKDLTTLAEWLGDDAESIHPAEGADLTLSYSAAHLYGLLAITNDLDQDSSADGIQVTFSGYDDDGGRLIVDNAEIWRNSEYNAEPEDTVTFLGGEGLYDFDYVYYNNNYQDQGDATFEIQINGQDIASSQLFVPEPATIGILGLGGLALLRRRSGRN